MKTKQVIKFYENIWNELGNKSFDSLKEAVITLTKRFAKNRINMDWIKNKKVLDMGCGSGRISSALAKMGAKEVIGIDFTKGRQYKHNRVRYIRGDVLNLPFKDNSFDFIMCTGVLHHTKNSRKGLKELYRVLKSGGKSWFDICGKSIIYDMADTFRVKLKGTDSRAFMAMLNMFSIPMNKIHFLTDLLFAPYREYTTRNQVEKWFKELGFKFRFLDKDVDYGLNEVMRKKPELRPYLKGADLRYLLTKR